MCMYVCVRACACVYVCVHVSVSMYVYTCMWWPEVDAGVFLDFSLPYL